MTRFSWALIGPGAIARRFATAVGSVPDARLHRVWGRDAARAAAFVAGCRGNGTEPVQVAARLADLLEDPLVDGVYVATPHAHHAEFVRLCIEAGKPVLCEKPMAANLAQGASLVELAARRGVFLMEALWTRLLPVYETVAEWLGSDAIGPLRTIQSSFCFEAQFEPSGRLFNPALAGGALLDLGVYNLAMTRWVIQQANGVCPEPASIRASGRLAPTGVDQRVSATLDFSGGLRALFLCGLDGPADNGLQILGERGRIEVAPPFWGATETSLQRSGEPERRVQKPFRENGFEYQIEEAQRCIRAGLIESPRVAHSDTLAALRWMDEIRRQMGVRYPFE